MDISKIQSSLASTIKHSRADESEQVRTQSSSVASKEAGAADADALQLKGRAGESSELTAARTAMRQIDTLDEVRKAEIQERIRSGYYSQPETIEKVSASMAEALTPKQSK